MQPQSQGFTQKQLENLENRLATAHGIVNRLESQAKRLGRAGAWKQSTLEALYGLSSAALEQVERNSASLDSLAESIREAASDPNLIGDPSADLVYTPITPCRYIDTRVGAKVSPAAPRGYDLLNNGAVYGGSAGCSVQQNVVAALAMNVTITEPNGAPGFLAVKPTLGAPLTSFMNWYEAGVNVQLANSGVVTMDQSVATNEFFIQVSEVTHVVVDFFGYFAAPEATALDHNVLFTTDTIVGSVAYDVFSPACPAGWRVTGGGWVTNSYADPPPMGSRPVNGLSTVLVTGVNAADRWLCQGTSDASTTVYCHVVCGRTPGR